MIDNSIDAGASIIQIELYKIKGNIELSVIDNGQGMDNEELENALLFGVAVSTAQEKV